MCYVTGQPILFVGCGQVRLIVLLVTLLKSILLNLLCVLDIYRPPSTQGCERRTGYTERLIRSVSCCCLFPELWTSLCCVLSTCILGVGFPDTLAVTISIPLMNHQNSMILPSAGGHYLPIICTGASVAGYLDGEVSYGGRFYQYRSKVR